MTGAIPTTGVNDDASSDDEDVFYSEGSGLQDALTGPEVSALLISNGSRMKPAKRGRGFVSVDNHTGFSKSEPKVVRLRIDALRNKDNRIRAKKQKLQAAANTIPMSKMTSLKMNCSLRKAFSLMTKSFCTKVSSRLAQ
jgi:hypothetical protein